MALFCVGPLQNGSQTRNRIPNTANGIALCYAAGGSVLYPESSDKPGEQGTIGCLDPDAMNFDSAALVHNIQMCQYGKKGCVDPSASNFDRGATIHESCVYEKQNELE